MTKDKTTENFSPDPPPHLSEKARILWKHYAGPVLKSPAQLALFETGLAALDRATQAREIISREGMTLANEKGKMPHAHPLFNIQKESEAHFLKVWKTLNLNWPGKWAKNNLPTIDEL
jgi:P27 family predicted phage terminase small subunit